jgi:small subunit ribosomal protein S15
MKPSSSTDPKETGSPQSQISSLTKHINELSAHLAQNKKDYASQRGLLILVARRRHLLNYLKSRNLRQYQEIIQALDLRK